MEEPYTPIDAERVAAFLRENPVVLSLLRDALPAIRERFTQPYGRIHLEVLSPPEADDRDELLVEIETTAPPRAALDALDGFTVAWLQGRPLEERRHVVFDARTV